MAIPQPPKINAAGLKQALASQFRGLNPNDPPSWPILPRMGLCVALAGLGRSLSFELFRPGSVSVRDYYAELPIALKVTGRYHDVGAFASDVANLSRIVTLNNLAISPNKDGTLVMDATAKTFRYLD